MRFLSWREQKNEHNWRGFVNVAARARPFEEALSIRNERRATSKLHIAPEPGKGRPPLRKCPDDFDVVFVEIGRLDCEVFYRAARVTIDRWLVERGKQRLITQRALYVEHQRRRVRERDKAKLQAQLRKPLADRRQVSLCLARAAAHHLRARRNGGWFVSRTLEGDWRVGTVIRSSGELLDMAKRTGFDERTAEIECRISDEGEEQQ